MDPFRTPGQRLLGSQVCSLEPRRLCQLRLFLSFDSLLVLNIEPVSLWMNRLPSLPDLTDLSLDVRVEQHARIFDGSPELKPHRHIRTRTQRVYLLQ
jgi:hypothetical protein